MENIDCEQMSFIRYEYKEVMASSDEVSMLLDGYKSFGWELNRELSGDLEKFMMEGRKKIVLHLRRKRSIVNKAELSRLQKNFEACLDEIHALEKSKESKPTIYALAVGIVGTAFMALATFAATADTPYVLLTVLFAVPGFLGWILPIFLYRNGVARRTQKIAPFIEKKYDEIYELCEKGTKLLY
ncbi:MAG: hypothetical protein LUD69_02100 [Oscillospiraceae bacterium]|nr:hypothetical protein [Oscillospiraceae bacterium]